MEATEGSALADTPLINGPALSLGPGPRAGLRRPLEGLQKPLEASRSLWEAPVASGKALENMELELNGIMRPPFRLKLCEVKATRPQDAYGQP